MIDRERVFEQADTILTTKSTHVGREYLTGKSKRILDIVGSSVPLPFVIPAIALLAIPVAAHDKKWPYVDVGYVSPITQRRFRKWKIRSMIFRAMDEEENLPDDVHSRAVKNGHDHRILPGIGEALRETSSDELPQLLNVWLGQMSLVGSRGQTRKDLRNFILPYKDREPYRSYIEMLKAGVKLGITGLPQILGRATLDLHTELELNKMYWERANLWSDIRILRRTPQVVKSKVGAK